MGGFGVGGEGKVWGGCEKMWYSRVELDGSLGAGIETLGTCPVYIVSTFQRLEMC